MDLLQKALKSYNNKPGHQRFLFHGEIVKCIDARTGKICLGRIFIPAINNLGMCNGEVSVFYIDGPIDTYLWGEYTQNYNPITLTIKYNGD